MLSLSFLHLFPPAVAAQSRPLAPAEPTPVLDPRQVGAAPPSATLPAQPVPAIAAPTQLKIEIANGTSMRFGMLWQGQYELRGNSANDDLSHNLFLRRFALLLGGTVLDRFEYFFDTDFADLLKAPTGDQGLKNGPGISTKDAFVTFKAIGDELKLDAGLLLPAGTHNFLQGGGTMYAWDFFLNTFRHGNVFGSTNNPYGRDVGAQLRGLVLDGLLEYRVGVFQGKRNPPLTQPASRAAARNALRLAGRVQLNFIDPETTYFYGGTYLGTKKVLSVGASADFQYDEDGSYRALGADAFLDLPVGPGGLTAQLNVLHRDGGDLIAQLPKQTALMVEGGYRFEALKLSPILRYEQRWAEGAASDETDWGAGLAYWAFGHTSNLKAFYTRLVPHGDLAAFDQFNLQWQVFFY